MMMTEQGRIWQCRSCPFEGLQTAVEVHVVTKHVLDEEVPWLCGGCSQRYVKERQLTRHIRQKHAEGAARVKGAEACPWETSMRRRSKDGSVGYYMKTLAGPSGTTSVSAMAVVPEAPHFVMSTGPEMEVAPDAPTFESPGLEMAEVPDAPTLEMSPGLEMAEVPEAPTFASPGQEVVELSPFARSPGLDFLQVPEAVTPIPMTPERESSEVTTVALATELDPCEHQLVKSVLVACQPYIVKVVTLQATVADQAEELDALRREVAPHDEEIKELRKELAELKEEITSLRNSRQGGSGRQSPLARQARRSPVPRLKRVGPAPGPRREVSPDRGLSQTMQRVRKALKKM